MSKAENEFQTDYEDFEVGIAEMVFDGLSDEAIASEARRLAAAIRAQLAAQIGAPIPPLSA